MCGCSIERAAKATLLFWPPESVEICCNPIMPDRPKEPRCERYSCSDRPGNRDARNETGETFRSS